MKKCIVCHKINSKIRATCSWKCAGILAQKKRKANKVQYFKKAQKLYSSPEKGRDIKTIIKCLKYGNNSKSWKILTFEGGSVFTTVVRTNFYPHTLGSFTSIDKDKTLVDIAKIKLEQSIRRKRAHQLHNCNCEYCNKKVGEEDIKEEINFWQINNCTLAEQLKKDQTYNFIWLDYCGNFSEAVLTDLKFLLTKLEPTFFFFITLFRGREKMDSLNDIIVTEYEEYLSYRIKKLFGGYLFYQNHYKKMITSGFCSIDLIDGIIPYLEDKWSHNRRTKWIKERRDDVKRKLLSEIKQDYDPKYFGVVGQKLGYISGNSKGITDKSYASSSS